MTVYQAVGKTLLNATAISSIVSTRVYHGIRLPNNAGLIYPAINYYKIAGFRNVLNGETISISCRAGTIETALQLSAAVLDLFVASNGMGKYGGYDDTFSAARISLVADHGIMMEEEAGKVIYNSPVDIFIIY